MFRHRKAGNGQNANKIKTNKQTNKQPEANLKTHGLMEADGHKRLIKKAPNAKHTMQLEPKNTMQLKPIRSGKKL